MAVKFRDYYEILGVSRDADAETIRKAFRKLARLHHPDVAKDKKGAEEKFKEINEAYEVLGDPEKRKKYDALGADWRHGAEFRPPPGWAGAGPWRAGPGTGSEGGPFEFHFGGTGFSDFFESFFGATSAGAGRRSAFGGFPGEEEFSGRGQDIEGDIMVTLEEVLKGSARQVTVRRPGPPDRPPRVETYQVRIPPGIREGQRIRLAGQGGAGIGGGGAGDLFLRVRLERHPDFRVQDADVHRDLDLAPWEAVLGCRATLATLEGQAALRIPPGAQAGKTMRLRGMGLPKQGGGRGDLLAVVRIRMPERVTEREKELWEQLSRVSAFNPRSGE